MEKHFEIDKLLGKGITSEVYSIKDDNEKIIKLFFENIEKDKIIEEYDNTKYLRDIGVKVPNVFEITNVASRTGIVMEKIEGKTLAMYAREMPDKIVSILSSFGKTIALVNNVEDKRKKVPSQKEHYKDLIMKLEDDNKKRKLLELLHGLPDGDYICHNDVHLNNTMIEKEKLDEDLICEGTMIDWDGVTRGNPIGNFAFAYVFLQSTPIPKEQEKQMEYGLKRFEETYFSYSIHKPNAQEVNRWKMLAAAALFVGNEEFIKVVKDEEVKKRTEKRLQTYSSIMEEYMKKKII